MAERCPVHQGPGCGGSSPYQMLPRQGPLWPLTLAICGAHAPPWRAGAFIYDHLGRVEQTYVAEGRFFLFIKFMALPRLHTVKTGRIGPKVSYRMTASDVGTSVNSVGAVEGNEAADNSEARCPVKRWGLWASRRGIQAPTWKGSRVGVCWWPRQGAPGPWPCLVTGSWVISGGDWEKRNWSPGAFRDLVAGPAAGESSEPVDLHLQMSAGREKR